MGNSIVKKINGKDRGFKFSLLMLELFSEKSGISLPGIAEHLEGKPFKSIIILLWAANKVYNKGKEVTDYEIDDWMSTMSQEDFQDIWNCFEDSTVDLLGKIEGGTKKK